MKKLLFNVLLSIVLCGSWNTGLAATVSAGLACGSGDVGTCLSGSVLCPENTTRVLWGGNSCESKLICCRYTTASVDFKINKDAGLVGGAFSVVGNTVGTVFGAVGKVFSPVGDVLFGGKDKRLANQKAESEAVQKVLKKLNLAKLASSFSASDVVGTVTGSVISTIPSTKTGPVFSGPGMRAGADTLKASLKGGISTLDSLPALINSWTKFLLPILAVLAVAAIVWAGLLYITSSVDDGNIEKAKKIVMYVVVGIILVMSSNVIVNTLSTGGSPNSAIIVDWIVGWTRFLLPIMAVLAVAAVVWAGFLYVTSAVDDGNVEKAKKIIMYVVVGILVTLSAYALVNTVLSSLF
jgi:hypothetical protein